MESIEVNLVVKALIATGSYQTETQVIQDAIAHLLEAHPEYRTQLAIHLHRQQDISLGKAAEIAGVSVERMKRLLLGHGIQPRLGQKTVAQAEIEAFRKTLLDFDTKRPAELQEIAAYTFPGHIQDRIEELLDKKREGDITEDETRELDRLILEVQVKTVEKAKAMAALKSPAEKAS